jgi:hypothetical protein
MELWKFQSMLQANSIFFSRADKQTDKLEGEYPKGMLAELETRFRDRIPSADGTHYTFLEWHTRKEIPSRLISCWSVSPSESQVKWNEYAHFKESIAIRSTVERLKNGFFNDEEGPVVWIGRVRYGEDENKLPSSSVRWGVNFWLYPFFAKNDCFRWENEVRAIVNIAVSDSQSGSHVKADLQKLIESVWIHPQSPPGFRDQVGIELASYGFRNVMIHQSPWDCLPR